MYPETEFQRWMEHTGACAEAREWVGSRTVEEAWAECAHTDWMLWFVSVLGLRPPCECTGADGGDISNCPLGKFESKMRAGGKAELQAMISIGQIVAAVQNQLANADTVEGMSDGL